jgi:outer membrane receptor protein involved in Fe transport
MYRKLLLVFLGMFLISSFVFASGKLRGKVTDKESGEPLIGASVLIEGTTLGGFTDINGEYIIFNVPVGVHAMKVSYVGYATLTVQNIRVNEGITTIEDFKLSSSTVELQAIVIVAERPLVQRNTTNTVRITTQEEIETIPFRGLNNIVALSAGVVQKEGQLYIRGGRSNDVGYFLDGADVTNPLNRQNIAPVVQEGIEEFQVQAGGFTAEYGGANAGIIQTSLRTGGQKYRVTLDYQTDDFAKPGEKFLGTNSFGFRNAIFSVSGPITDKIRFFVLGQNNYYRNQSQRFIEGFKFTDLKTDASDQYRKGPVAFPKDIEVKPGYLAENWSYTNTGQGTLLFDLTNEIKFRLGGYFSTGRNRENNGIVGNIASNMNLHRAPIAENTNITLNGKFTHILSTKTFYEVTVNFNRAAFERTDPIFGSDWRKYADSTANVGQGDPFYSRYVGPIPYTTSSFEFQAPGTVRALYEKNNQQSFGLNAAFTSQLSSNWEFKAGGKIDLWTMRQYRVANPTGALQALYGADGKGNPTYNSLQGFERDAFYARAGSFTTIGYDLNGNKTDDGLYAPKNPVFASTYIQNKFEFGDLVVNFGLRYEYYKIGDKSFTDQFNPAYDEKTKTPIYSQMEDIKPFSYLLPRLSFSFPVTDKTVFYAQYGKYAQMPRLNNIYSSYWTIANTLIPSLQGTAYQRPLGWFIKPERVTNYELGFRQQFSENAAFTATAFYKDTRDLVAVRRITDPSNPRYYYNGYTNEDFGTIKGLEFTLTLRRVNRLQAQVNYTLSDARGTGSTATSSFNAVERPDIGRFPRYVSQLDFNQTHRGTLILDYRFGKDDGGPILERLGVNLIFTFNSGSSFTLSKPLTALGQADIYNVATNILADGRTRFPAEALNSSTTPWFFNIDLAINKVFSFGSITAEVYVNILNVLNTKNIINVYPLTGNANDDGWLTNSAAKPFLNDQQYLAFYNAFNRDNRWALQDRGGIDTYASPRQIRVGVRIGY